MADDWLDLGDWGTDLAYPTLPRTMTNAATSKKKRKYKELYVTPELLDKPVRLKAAGDRPDRRACTAMRPALPAESPHPRALLLPPCLCS
jgi:hypothetical protein